jgi:hypothetical protein
MNKFGYSKGSALIIVLIVLLLVMILFSMVILYGSYHFKLASKDLNETKAFYMAESGIEAALASLNSGPDKVLSFSDTVNGSGSFYVDVKPFGAFLLCTSTGKSANVLQTIKCLIGCKVEGKFKNVLNLGGQDYPLMLAGKTKIVGDVLVSSAGVLPGRFKGQGFSGEKLVDGEIIQSPVKRLPDYDQSIINNYLENFRGRPFENGTVYSTTFMLSDDNISEINSDSILLYESDLVINLEKETLDLTGKSLRVEGQLRISGDSKIMGYGAIETENDISVEGNSIIKDVVLISKKDALFKDESKFAGQLISFGRTEFAEQASTANNATLVNVGDKNDNDRCIYLSGYGEIEATIISDIQSKDISRPGESAISKNIELSGNCHFRGAIYNTGYSQISGSIKGSLSTNYLYLYDAPTVYIDWLVNTTIENIDNPDILPAVFGTEGEYVKSGNI